MTLDGKEVIVLAEDLYEDLELWCPLLRLREEGAKVRVVGPKANREYTSKHGYPVTSDAAPSDVEPSRIDAVVVPGGYAPDRMRRNEAMVNLVRAIHEQGGLVAFICHGG